MPTLTYHLQLAVTLVSGNRQSLMACVRSLESKRSLEVGAKQRSTKNPYLLPSTLCRSKKHEIVLLAEHFGYNTEGKMAPQVAGILYTIPRSTLPKMALDLGAGLLRCRPQRARDATSVP